MPIKERLLHGRRLVIFIFAAVLAALVAGCVVYIALDGGTSAESDAEYMGSAASPDNMVAHSSGGVSDTAGNGLDRELFEIDGWKVSYPGAQLGVDVSSHQGSVDWPVLKAEGVEFAMLRLGYRGYTEGGLFTDETFEENFAAASNAGVALGVYFFSQAVSEEEARQEAQFVIKTLSEREAPMGVMFDWENVSAEDARTAEVSAAEITPFAKAFCEEIAAAGYTAGVYFNMDQAWRVYDIDELEGYRLWLAEYCVPPTCACDFQLWQYTATASLNGIDTRVDMNLFFGE